MDFLQVEATSGLVLLAAAAAALLWANSSAAAAYPALWQMPVDLGVGALRVNEPLRFWVNDGLMTLFFLLVGLEIRREMHEGALADIKLATLPAIAALGGVLVPALIYTVFNANTTQWRGWAVPTATDIAFAVGVLALLGKRVPPGLRILGVHPALSGVIAGLLTPVSEARRIEHRLHPWVAFGIMPLFAFANAGVNLSNVNLHSDAILPLVGGIVAGLVVGKPVGILLVTFLAVRFNWCALPEGVHHKHVAVIACLGGIGFTMSIFISQLAFADEAGLMAAKVAILIGSSAAAVVGLIAGYVWLKAPGAA